MAWGELSRLLLQALLNIFHQFTTPSLVFIAIEIR